MYTYFHSIHEKLWVAINQIPWTSKSVSPTRLVNLVNRIRAKADSAFVCICEASAANGCHYWCVYVFRRVLTGNKHQLHLLFSVTICHRMNLARERSKWSSLEHCFASQCRTLSALWDAEWPGDQMKTVDWNSQPDVNFNYPTYCTHASNQLLATRKLAMNVIIISYKSPAKIEVVNEFPGLFHRKWSAVKAFVGDRLRE